MDTVSFHGSFETGNHELVAALLRDWVKARDIHVKIRLGGVEISHEDEVIYLYAHQASARGRAPFFLLEGHMLGTLAEANARLQALLRACRDRDIACRLEYVQVNEDWAEVSEQFVVS